MARKKKSTSVDDYLMAHMPASDAARQAVQCHPDVMHLESSLKKAIASTIRRVMSHRPLLKRRKK